jgi:membrane-associated phospholipid phosphatase
VKDLFTAFNGIQVSTTAASGGIRKIIASLHSTDRLLIIFWCFLSVVSLILHSRISAWRLIIASNLAAIILVCSFAYITQLAGSRFLRWVHDWSAFALVVFTYKQLYYMIAPIHHGKDYDALLIAIDRWLFRVNPTEWLAGYSNPFLTEVLQIAYSLFYLFFIVVGLEIYRKRDVSSFRFFSFTIVYGFFISYIGYFFLPAVGPRFTLHDFSKIDAELPGLFLTPYLRWFVNIWESIHPGVSNAVAIASAQRDVFPSGHAMMTMAAIFMANKYKLKVRPAVFFAGILLIIATVYLRYHYLIDVLAGALLVFLCLITSSRLHAFVKSDSGENP